jgi:hypothetical protein
MKDKFFGDLQIPRIYAYTTSEYESTPWQGDRKGSGLLKVGYTTGTSVERIRQQFPVKTPSAEPFKILVDEPAVDNQGKFFSDHQVHKQLKEQGIERVAGEWFECSREDVMQALTTLRTGKPAQLGRSNSYKPRPEQTEAVEKTAAYFNHFNQIKGMERRAPHFLWNAKMRFGKTFTAYQLALEMGWTRIMVLTYKPAVEGEWRKELMNHVDFEGWQFLGRGDTFADIDESKPLCWFASFQDILGRTKAGQVKDKFEVAHAETWDCIILDEYHFGAWNEASKELYDAEPSERIKGIEEGPIEEVFPLRANSFLYLSGTPFRALANGEFLEDQIFTWSYTDEQRAKQEWSGPPETNPYLELPKMVMLTYQLPDSVRQVALKGEDSDFNLNEFFRAEKNPDDRHATPKFAHENEVQRWLSLIRGQYLEAGVALPEGGEEPPWPYAESDLLNYMNHTFWYLPSVDSCYAMEELLGRPANNYFHEYRVVVAAGTAAGIGLEALPPVRRAIRDGLQTKTITLSCGKLTTGVSVPQWCGLLMLKNTSSPETYFQTAFRVQTPWFSDNSDPLDPNRKEIYKRFCYVFDFAPNRALNLISEYTAQVEMKRETKAEERVQEFLNFLPVLAYDGFSFRSLNAGALMDFAATGVGATMLALRWQSRQLVRVDNGTLEKLMNNPEILEALKKVEFFSSLGNIGQQIKKVVNSEASLNDKKKKNQPLNPKEKLEEKSNKSFKKELQENLLKFVARVPVFMYLTDYREESLRDVITQLETDLFTRVTGLTIPDFEKLCDIGVFNSQAMDSAIFSFRRFEIGSLDYAGGGKTLEKIGGFDTVVSAKEAFNGK